MGDYGKNLCIVLCKFLLLYKFYRDRIIVSEIANDVEMTINKM